ncbi:hypothetical protein GCM10009601_49860 [Streptomyces thermospinosisporus]|uniref:TniQ domain-containing protein n=1 Tax=Streptomyces thermospinosisporus TaxID=161482 RepID=A0ABP4JV16_9ACTN
MSTARKTAQKRRTLIEPVIQPIPGESLTSWIGALAEQQGFEMKPLLRELHLDRLGGIAGSEMRLSDPVVRRMEKLTGVGAERLHAMTLARYAGNALPHLPLLSSDGVAVQQWHKGAWFHHWQARWCPRCLRDNDGPRWLLRWKLPWSFACVDHSVYVVTECQACWDTVRFRQDAPPERTCENWTDEGEWSYGYGLGEPCGFPLVLCQPVPVSDDSVLALQKRVNAWLDGTPTHEDRMLVALAAVLIPLLSPSMVRRGDPLLRYAVRSSRAPPNDRGGVEGRGPTHFGWRPPSMPRTGFCAAGIPPARSPHRSPTFGSSTTGVRRGVWTWRSWRTGLRSGRIPSSSHSCTAG